MITKTRNTKKPKNLKGSSAYSVGKNMFVGWVGLATKILTNGYDAGGGWV